MTSALLVVKMTGQNLKYVFSENITKLFFARQQQHERQ